MMLSLIVFLPLAGALLVLLLGGRGDRAEREPLIRNVALLFSLATFAATLWLWWRFDPASADYQFVEQYAWMPQFGIQYLIGVDGISLFLLVLTGFLTPLALLSSWESIHKNVKNFSFFVLALETAMLGVFVSIDLFLFYVFWDAVLIPMYFLIGIWGYDRRVYAAVKFILYTMPSSGCRGRTRPRPVSPASTSWTSIRCGSRAPPSSGCSSPLHSPSSSRCRSSRSTPGCLTRTSRRRPPARSSWPA
jgi:NADH-quinone oxidoreductase subunit M